mmetsp:Transcript_35547/g.54350  ORF Transcript_35547/g.54350 Transcript_35547/m.54350 type:complete len:160 (+) Transcript_35547:857-1336(+)
MFGRWKKNSDLMTTSSDCNEFGIVRKEINALKRDAENLKKFLNQEGYLPKEIQTMEEEAQEKYGQTVKKVAARLRTYGDGLEGKNNRWLLPWCLDKWKQYMIERRSYGYWLDYLETLSSKNKTDLKVAFEKWKDFKPKRVFDLERKPYHILNSMDILNK